MKTAILNFKNERGNAREEIKKQICEVGHKIYALGFVAANDGNISVKYSDNEFYCTPTGVSKGSLTPDMIIKVDKDGNKLEGKVFEYLAENRFSYNN